MRSINPHRPTDVVFEVEPSGPKAVEAAVAEAQAAFMAWTSEPAQARGGALGTVADAIEARSSELVDLVVREVGKPVTEARGEVARAVAICRYYAQMVLTADGETFPAPDGRSLLIVKRHPLGVCIAITPWNFPVAIPIWKLAPALAFANAAVLKPAPAAAATAELLAEIVSGHLPDGLVQIVHGDATTAQLLLDQADVAAVSFTGSVGAGQAVAQRAATRGLRYQCEMGGQNPSVVLADADLDRAASAISGAAMGFAGQKCTATSRILVDAAVYVPFRDRLVAAISDLVLTEPERPDCNVGPVIDASSRDRALAAVGQAGGRVLTGGRAFPHEGSYLEPTVVELDGPVGPLAHEEVFAPVAALLRTDSLNDAVNIANNVRYGLVSAVFTADLSTALAVADRLEAGLVRVNAATSGVDYHVPFGGTKASSSGPREQGVAARDFYTESRTVLITP